MFERMKTRLRAAFSNERGVFDTTSIMVGVLVTGIIGAVAAVSFVLIVPWFQNQAASNDMKTIKTAEDSSYSDNSNYTDLGSLYSAGYLNHPLTPACVQVSGGSYTIYAQSASGTIYSYTPTALDPTTVSSSPCTFSTYGG